MYECITCKTPSNSPLSNCDCGTGLKPVTLEQEAMACYNRAAKRFQGAFRTLSQVGRCIP